MRRILLVAVCFVCLRENLPAQWAEVGPAVPGSVVSLMADSRYVFLGTTRGHVWRRPVTDFTTGVETEGRLEMREVADVRLANFPNPCNSSTVFTVQLPSASTARLSLFDILGRNVLVVLDGRLDAGTHRLPVELGSLPSGWYVAVLNAGEVRRSGRLLLLR